MMGGSRSVVGRAGLLERGGALACIEQAIGALRRGERGVLIVQGAAGIGKSALLRALCERVTCEGMQLLTARGSDLERDFGFGIVRQLLEVRMVRAEESERAQLLAGAARLATPVLGLSEEGVGDSFAALHGLYWLVANLALDGPLVLAVDDLHLADEPSLRWLLYLCHRLEGLPVLVAATTRPPRLGYPQLLKEFVAMGGAQIVCPGPLSESAVAQLIHEGLSTQPDPAFVTDCAKATSGNPFVLRELIFDLAAEGVAPSAAQAASLAGRVPAGVERTILARLGRLDHTAVDLLHALTVLGDGIELRLAAALAELDSDTAAAAVDALVNADLLATARPMQFVHPLVRSATYEQLPTGVRARAHARAARLLMQEGAAPEQIAAQLLLCEPAGDVDTVQALRDAAAAALARGAPGAAIIYLRRALTEPPPEPVRAVVLGELGNAEKIARDPAAVVHLEQARQATTDPVTRAQLAEQLTNVLFYAGQLDQALAVLRAGLDDLGNRDPNLMARLHASKAYLESCGIHPTELDKSIFDLIHELVAAGSPFSRSAQLMLASLLAVQGECCHRVVGLVECGWDDGRFLVEETSEALAALMAVWALIDVDDLDRADALVDAMLADAQARGLVVGIATAAGQRGAIGLRRGALAEAEADTRAALELVTEHNLAPAIPVQVAWLGLVLLERGELAEATALVEGVMNDLVVVGAPNWVMFLQTRGRVRLAYGQREQAIADLRYCGELAGDIQVHNPNCIAWRSTLALALAPEHPQEAWELAQTELQLARRAGSSRAIGIALRVCGLLAGGKNGIELLDQSVAVLEPTPMRLELAYSLTELGAALRRAGTRTAAREPLRRGLDLATRCGATRLAERAREEALAAGARPRRPWTSGVHALTPSELRVARLAAQALGNREIAQALLITTKTVSDHLTSVYRKLNISSRDQLTGVMTAHASLDTLNDVPH